MQEAARNAFITTIAVLVLLLLGDYIGYKIGRRRLALISATIALVTVVVFAIYAAVNI